MGALDIVEAIVSSEVLKALTVLGGCGALWCLMHLIGSDDDLKYEPRDKNEEE